MYNDRQLFEPKHTSAEGNDERHPDAINRSLLETSIRGARDGVACGSKDNQHNSVVPAFAAAIAVPNATIY